jgi:ferritin-like metal-binding protein YciE
MTLKEALEISATESAKEIAAQVDAKFLKICEEVLKEEAANASNLTKSKDGLD